MGLGALVFGSGAMTVQAGFSGNDVSQAADMRVVVEDELIIEPGASFRDGSGDYDSTIDPSSGKFAGTNYGDFFSSDATGGNLDPEDLPAAYVSNDTNGDISIKTAVGIGTQVDFSDLLRVTNNTTEDKDIGINFSDVGVDTTTGNTGGEYSLTNHGGDVDVVKVIDAYNFYYSSTSNRISTDASDWNSNGSPQKVPNSPGGATVSANGGSIEIGLQITTDTGVNLGTGNIKDQLDAATDTSQGNPFGGTEDTVQLVDEITIGTDPDTA